MDIDADSSGCFDRDHNPISMRQAMELLADINARRIAETKVGDHVVSTVFLVMDHSHGSCGPVLYETMVFKGNSNLDLYMERYFTAEAALAGHDQVVAELRRFGVPEGHTLAEEIFGTSM